MRYSKLFIIITLILCLFTACDSAPKSDNQVFEETRDSLINSILADSPLDLHFCLSDTLEFDAANTEKTLSNDAGNNSAIFETHDTLSSIDPGNLSEENRYQYSILSNYIENQLDLSAFEYKYEPLSAFSGEQVQLPLLMAEFPFHGSSDLEIYLKLLEDFPDYFEEIIEYEKLKKEAGEFMSENCYHTVIDFCKNFPTENPADHFLAKAFEKKLDNLFMEDELK